ncbi:hypothetical protein MFIFM68171_04747 [Madurella fahalii]|uniref:Uncharacterized protein n=1 Tax=Madurella fahalii TaxID=1157608 RepID=A0ABQ0G9U6_9PEZI
MLSLNSAFVNTVFPVRDNSVKSLIFRAAELLLVFAIWKLFSLLAAVQSRFTSFVVFSESPAQKAYFVLSRGWSKDALLVTSFTVMYTLAQLYGTLLWALDAPGYVTQTRRAAASSTLLLDDPEYIVSYRIKPDSLNTTDVLLSEKLSVGMFRPGSNITLTGSFDQGTPEVVSKTPLEGPPRILLDDEGWLVTTDIYAHVAVRLGGTNMSDQFTCGYADLPPGQIRYYKCTFDNEWAPDMLETPVGNALVAYNKKAFDNVKFGTVRPRRNDIWTSIGSSSGTAARVYMFTVAKNNRRHTFVSTIFKASIVALGEEVPQSEMRDLMTRSSAKPKPGEEELFEQGLTAVLKTLTAAQASNRSAAVGAVMAERYQLLESFWELFTLEDLPGRPILRVFRLTSVNITLLRSETVANAPIPFEPCSNPAYQNIAVGGKVIDTDCIGGAEFPRNGTAYFGQVDISAALHVDGLDSAPFASSAAALNPELWPWLEKNVHTLMNLLLSRGYALGLEAGLVTVQLTETTPGVSYLQILMVLLAALAALVGWGSLWLFASGHWSSSFLVSLLTTTRAVSSGTKSEPGVVCEIPDIKLEKRDGNAELRTDAGVFKHEWDELPI